MARGRPWTDSDDAAITAGAAAGRTAAMVGQAIKRNAGSVRNRAAVLGVSFCSVSKRKKSGPKRRLKRVDLTQAAAALLDVDGAEEQEELPKITGAPESISDARTMLAKAASGQYVWATSDQKEAVWKFIEAEKRESGSQEETARQSKLPDSLIALVEEVRARQRTAS